MRKSYLILCILFLFIISGCENDDEAKIVDVFIENYNLIYSNKDYSIYELKEYDTSLGESSAIQRFEDALCWVSSNVDNQYVLDYKDQYRHLNYGISNELYDVYDLDEYGVFVHCDLIYDGEPEDVPSTELVGTIRGIEIYRDSMLVCEMVLGQVVIDGFDFGYIPSGCTTSINSIGYIAYTSHKVYDLEAVLFSDSVSVEDIHELYMKDTGRRGSFD